VILCEMNLVLENRNMHDWAMRECWKDCVCVCVFFFFFCFFFYFFFVVSFLCI